MKPYYFILFFSFSSGIISGQADTSVQKNDSVSGRIYILQKVNRGGETLPEVEIKEVTIVGRSTGKKRSQLRRQDRLAYNVKKVYPYAVIVREKFKQVNSELSEIDSEKDRKEYLKSVEKEVFKEYEDDMRNLSLTQGKILIKLIDRETQNTSFELIKQYRGGFTASFWQGIARIFGTSLKAEYDPYGNDILLEYIIEDIEAGKL